MCVCVCLQCLCVCVEVLRIGTTLKTLSAQENSGLEGHNSPGHVKLRPAGYVFILWCD